MAEEIKRVIEVETTSSSKTIRELREEIDGLKKTISELTVGTKEYTEAQTRMSQAQEEVNQAMEITAKDEDAQVKSMQELRAIIDENTGSFGSLVARMQELKTGIDTTNANVRQLKKDYQSGEISVDAYTQGLQKNLEELQKLRTEQGDVRSSLNASTKALLAAEGSYTEMSQTLGQLRNAYRQLNKEQREGAFGTEMLNNIRRMDKELKAIDASMGNFQRNVGNYASAAQGFTPLNFQVQQLARELPSLTMSLQQFFLAISNNLPMFADEMTRAREANKALKSEGKATIPVFKQLLSSLFSWQTAIVVGITVLTAFGKEIGNFVKGLFSIKSPAEEAAEAIEKLNKNVEYLNDKAEKANTESLLKYTEAIREAKGDIESLSAAQKAYREELMKAEYERSRKTLEDAYEAEKVAYAAYVKDLNEETMNSLKEAQDAVRKARKDFAQSQYEIEKSKSDAIVEANKQERERQKELEHTAKAATKAAEEERKRAEAIREANAAFRDETALMQAEQGAGTQSGDLALAQEQFRQEMAAFEAMVDEKQITEELAMERRKLMLEQYGQEITEIQARYLKQENDQLLKALDEEMAAEFEADKDLVSQELKNSKERQKIADAEYKHKQMITRQTGALLQAGAQLAGESTAVGKAMAVAAATISTYQAAQAAYQAAFMPVPTYASPALGAINMAAAIATGLANIKSILSVDSSGGTGYGSSSSSGAAVSTPTVVTPPAVVQEVATVRSLTGASEEERLNQMASDQRVYLVYSDVEQAGKRVQVQQSETSF